MQRACPDNDCDFVVHLSVFSGQEVSANDMEWRWKAAGGLTNLDSCSSSVTVDKEKSCNDF